MAMHLKQCETDGEPVLKKQRVDDYDSDEEDDRMFMKTFTECSAKGDVCQEAMFAFLYHVTDIFSSLSENGHDMVPTAAFTEHSLKPHVMKAAGVEKYPEFHAMIRLGFQQFRDMQLKQFPEDKKLAYAESCKFIDNDQDKDTDYMFGSLGPNSD